MRSCSGGVRWLNQSLSATFDGEFAGFEAEVTYKAADGADATTAVSTPMRDITFLDEALFEKITAKHTVRHGHASHASHRSAHTEADGPLSISLLSLVLCGGVARVGAVLDDRHSVGGAAGSALHAAADAVP